MTATEDLPTDPIIFKGIKALTLADPQQQSLLRLALEGISVYSPHTAVDAAPGGLGDWLADIVTGTLPGPEPQTHTAEEGREQAPTLDESEKRHKSDEQEKQFKKPSRPSLLQRASTYSKPTYPKASDLDTTSDLNQSEIEHTRSVIIPVEGVAGHENAGYGRLVEYAEPQPLTHLIERIAHGVGSPKGFPVAIPQSQQVEDIIINSVGVCAGSGADILKRCDADLIFTGELSHHDALRMTEQGKCVVTLFHSNSERGYLSSVMKDKLTKVLKEEWESVRTGMKAEIDGRDDWNEEWHDAIKDDDVLVEVSERDRDPFGVVILQTKQEGKPLR
ncbi:uncharacterized protein KY384_005953 [Bacidia gigantensis]|uniref:uncharacterized protein n=1 Tax=Bacidia gigantensis TaxID=2732470 RepID=UPI001D03D95F|nr:uncharacterized protein KY384_005953 [Bacidia gigantensis]KAG8529317.1 hypothetical protein KY384_005953 [Bacidia gigantensis]